ncbi:type II toxin-antitoxin system VapC family toxin [Rhizobium sp. C4]|uniref:type II toxin-antitoxin system VapC family toxin n=1 Tax=Rhizobium sp. C4 TaxID=1349800 RepID=UPI001E4E8CF8|nr:type II toxin-antitoxin system VapC family toxin [Rhizobium sp. C4]MCD2172923.1 type II toxin-antitoxin system VapC family toxin [Rhizobium sp. C4]
MMFVDACAIIAILSDEPEADRISKVLKEARSPITSPVAILEVVLALSRPDKFGLPMSTVESLVLDFLLERGIEIKDMPPAYETTKLAISAADRYRAGRYGLNLGDCLHYACARHYRVPILATADEFKQTDLETV